MKLMMMSAAFAGAVLFTGCDPYELKVQPGEDLAAVQERVRALPADVKTNGVVVALPPGEFTIASGHLMFDEKDSGTDQAPIVWKGAPGGRTVITGSIAIPGDAFGPVTDPKRRERLDAQSRDQVFVADLAPYVKGNIPELEKCFGGVHAPPMVFWKGNFTTMAEWPNTGWAMFSNRVDKGTQVSKEVYPGAFKDGAFVFADPRTKRWHLDEGVWMKGYWTHDWAMACIKVKTIGAENGTNDVVRLDGTMSFGVMGGTWGRKERRFRVVNSFDELDAPGEWWIDRKAKKLYLHTGGVKPVDGDVSVAMNKNRLIQMWKTRNLVFEGISFERAFGGFFVQNKTENVTVKDCSFTLSAGQAAGVTGKRIKFLGCRATKLGEGFLRIDGGDRLKLERCDNLVENCTVRDFGILRRTYAGAFSLGGVGVTLRGCEISEAPHTAVFFSGNDHVIEYNNVHHVLMETGDAGAFYTGRDWTNQGTVMRHNFVHELGAEGADASCMAFYFDDTDCGKEVYGNVFWKVARGIMIGGGRQHPVHDNIFADCQIGLSIDIRGITWKCWNTPGNGWNLEEKAKKMHYQEEPWKSRYPLLANIMNDSPREPLYNPVTSNLFINCTKSTLSLQSDKRMTEILHKFTVDGNWAYAVDGGTCAATDSRLKAGAITVVTNAVDLGFVDLPKGDFRLKPGSPIGEKLPGIAALPMDRILGLESK